VYTKVYMKSRIQLQLTAVFSFQKHLRTCHSPKISFLVTYRYKKGRSFVGDTYERWESIASPNIGRKKTAGLTNRHPILLTGLSISVQVTMKYVEESLDEAPTTIAGQFMSVDGKPPVHY